MKKLMFKGVLFDFDGTLADTMEDNFKAWIHVLSLYGISITPEEYFPYEGMPLREFAGEIFKKNNIEISDISEIVQKKDSYYLKNNSFALYPGVEDLVKTISQNGIKTAIVTAGRRARVEISAGIEFISLFDGVVTAEMYERGKPNPDPFLQAANLIGCKPEDCLVIENAPLGIKSAKAAGMFCIAIPSTVGKEMLYEADEIIDKIGDLISRF